MSEDLRHSTPEQAYAEPPQVAFFHPRRTMQAKSPAAQFGVIVGGLVALPLLAVFALVGVVTAHKRQMPPGQGNRSELE